MGMVSRTESEKMAIAGYAEAHSVNAAKNKYGCGFDTAKKYHQKYGGGNRGSFLEHPDDIPQGKASLMRIEQLENELRKKEQENEKLRNIIIDKMLED